MSFSPSGGNISGADDVALSNPQDEQVLTYNSGTAKWTNQAVSASAPTYENLPAGTTVTIVKAGTWPARPTARTDIIVIWKGADPSPPIVSSGTGGMLDGVDMRFVTT